ncbi:MAG: cation transporter [Betaproteobacteria bacterium]|nr:cation transporter [Betaproteobacteria bacterium]
MENLQRMNDSTSCASPCNQQHVLTLDVTEIQRRQKQVLSVLILTVITMVVEIVAGHITGSMALQADGYHMGSHAGALGVAFLAYRMMSWERIRSRMNFGSGKILALGGYSNAIALGFVSLWMIIECIERLLSPKAISFDEALAVAVLGLIVNLASAWLLGWEGGVGHHHHGEHHHGEHHHGEHHHGEHHHGEHHHGEHHHGDHHHGDHHHADHHHADHHHSTDHNHHAALVHVLADALTSVFAIVALLVARQFPSAAWLDPVMGIVGALVILRWSWSLVKQTAVELLDFHPRGLSLQDLKAQIEKDGHRVWDLHVWSQGRGALVGMLSVTPAHPEADFKKYFSEHGRRIHLSVERIHRAQSH